MERVLMPNMCRICLKPDGSNKMLSMYDKDEEDESPLSMLDQLTGIDMKEEHLLTELPKKICKNCMCELQLSFQFYKKALQIHSYIVLAIKDIKGIKEASDTNVNNNTEAVEMKYNTEVISFAQSPGSSTEIEEMEVLEDECNETLETTMTLMLNDFNKIENMPIKEETTVLPKEVATKTCVKIKKDRRKDVLETKNSVESLPAEGEPFKKLSKRGRKPKTEGSATKGNTNFHVCDQCGNVFTKRGRLTDHIRIRHHETEAKYACEICDQRFYLREKLRRHMYQHLGGKPYKCGFCSRTFFYESIKKAHEAIHAGHKPYVCDKCNKSFAYSHALQKHKLIHDDIKLFSCHYCKKDFRLQHHIKQHEQTKAHIRAVQKQNEFSKTIQ